MERNLKQQAEQMVTRTARQRKAKSLLAVPAALVAAVTAFMLMSPALALEREPVCGKEEHVHGDDCYAQALICGYEADELIASEDGAEPHAHAHTDVCYGLALVCEKEEHEHDDSCYADAAAEEQSENAAMAPEPVCGIEEHTHEDACYDENGELICGKEEHTHSIDCLADPADTENENEAAGETEPAGEPETDVTATPETAGEAVEIEEDEAPEGAAIVKTFEDAQVRITAIYTAEANLPEGVELIATPITAATNAETFDEMVKAVNEALPEENVAPLEELQAAQEALAEAEATEEENSEEVVDPISGEIIGTTIINEDGTPLALVPAEEPEAVRPMLMYNIGFYLNGVEVEPEAPVDLEVQFLDAEGFPVGEEMTVLHMAESGAELLKSQTESDKNTASFTAGSFSPFLFTGKKSVVSFLNTLPEGESVTGELLDALTGGSDSGETNDDQQIDKNVTDSQPAGEPADVTEDKQDGAEPAEEETGETEDETATPETAEGGILGSITSGINKLLGGYMFISSDPIHGDSDEIATFENLKYYLTDSTETNIRLKQGVKITTNESISVIGGKTLDLNGGTIEFGGEAGEVHLFVISGSGNSLTITDTHTGNLVSTTDVASDMHAMDNKIWPDNQGDIDNWLASWDEGSQILIYYVTEPQPTAEKSLTGKAIGTNDVRRCYEYDLTGVGAIVGTNPKDSYFLENTLISVENGGHFTMTGGRITSPYGRAVATPSDNTSAVAIDVSGGYICGNGAGAPYWTYHSLQGAGIRYCGTGTVNIHGTAVIAANRAWNGGGVYVGDASGLTSSDNTRAAEVNVYENAVITGNLAVGGDDAVDFEPEAGYGGGGMYMVGVSSFTLNDSAYITNNYSSGAVHTPDNPDRALTNKELLKGCNDQGGGGIFFTGSGHFTIENGYVTGNAAWNVGGGIAIREDMNDKGTKFLMEGGFISSNVAYFREGGGIWMSCYVDGTIESAAGNPIYITNNETHTVRDWGGGGIFIHGESGRLKIYQALITENTAKGLGGGVGGCSTGRLFITADNDGNANDGVAIYGNKALADAKTVSGKDDDHYAMQREEFLEGYQDYFSALVSVITGNMLGGGDAAWKGSVDNVPVEIHRGNSPVEGNVITGLTSWSTDPDRRNAEYAANVFLTGNYSAMHGGAIMCNGILHFGDDGKREYGLGLDITGNKAFVASDKNNTKRTINPGQFQFQLTRYTDGTYEYPVAGEEPLVTSNINAEGEFMFSIKVPQSARSNWAVGERKTFYYKLTEVSKKGDDITYDDKSHTLEVTFEKIQAESDLIGGIPSGSGDEDTQKDITYYAYRIAPRLDKNNNVIEKPDIKVDGEYTTYSCSNWFYDVDHSVETRLHPKVTLKGTTFKNFGEEQPFLHIQKRSIEGAKPKLGDIVFTLVERDSGETVQKSSSSATDQKGYVGFALVRDKTYYLFEEHDANSGFRPAGPWQVVVNGNTVDLYEMNNVVLGPTDPHKVIRFDPGSKLEKATIVIDGNGTTTTDGNIIYNTPVNYYNLPETGGMGTAVYTVSGLSLLALAFYLEARRRRASR